MKSFFEPTENDLIAQLTSRETRLAEFRELNAPQVIQDKEALMIQDTKKRLAAFRKENA